MTIINVVEYLSVQARGPSRAGSRAYIEPSRASLPSSVSDRAEPGSARYSTEPHRAEPGSARLVSSPTRGNRGGDTAREDFARVTDTDRGNVHPQSPHLQLRKTGSRGKTM
jgi:hypothetical protein